MPKIKVEIVRNVKMPKIKAELEVPDEYCDKPGNVCPMCVDDGVATICIIIPAICLNVDYFRQRKKSKGMLFMRILREMEKLHKQKHEVNFILVSDDVPYLDFDRVMGVPIERATLPKGVQFVVAERKVKENEK